MFKRALFEHTDKVDAIAQKNKSTTDKQTKVKTDTNSGRNPRSYGEAIAQSYNEARAKAVNEAGKVRNAQAIHDMIAKAHSVNKLREQSGLSPMPFNVEDIQYLVKSPHDAHMRERQMGPFPLRNNTELQNYLKARKAYLNTSSQNRAAVEAQYQQGKDGSEYTTVQGFGAPTFSSDTSRENYYNTDMNAYAETTGNPQNKMNEGTVVYPGLANSDSGPFTHPKTKVPNAYLKNWNFSLDMNSPDTKLSYTPPSLQTQIPGDAWYESDKRQNLTQPTYNPN